MRQHETTLHIGPGSRDTRQLTHQQPRVLLGSHLLLDMEGQPLIFSSCLSLLVMDTYTIASIG